jgi:hypothetical protein
MWHKSISFNFIFNICHRVKYKLLVNVKSCTVVYMDCKDVCVRRWHLQETIPFDWNIVWFSVRDYFTCLPVEVYLWIGSNYLRFTWKPSVKIILSSKTTTL